MSRYTKLLYHRNVLTLDYVDLKQWFHLRLALHQELVLNFYPARIGRVHVVYLYQASLLSCIFSDKVQYHNFIILKLSMCALCPYQYSTMLNIVSELEELSIIFKDNCDPSQTSALD